MTPLQQIPRIGRFEEPYRLLVFGSKEFPHGLRSTVAWQIGEFLRKRGILDPIILTGESTGVETFALDFAIKQGIPHVLLRVPRRGQEMRDWIAAQACEEAIGFLDPEDPEPAIVQLLITAGKPVFIHVLGDHGFEALPKQGKKITRVKKKK